MKSSVTLHNLSDHVPQANKSLTNTVATVQDVIEKIESGELRFLVSSEVSTNNLLVMVGAVDKSLLDNSHLLTQMLCLVLTHPLSLDLGRGAQLLL